MGGTKSRFKALRVVVVIELHSGRFFEDCGGRILLVLLVLEEEMVGFGSDQVLF